MRNPKSSVVVTEAKSHSNLLVFRALKAWLAQLSAEIGQNIPDPTKTERLIMSTERLLQTTLRKPVGSGSNAIAFLTTAGSVAKYTIDAQEAKLWKQGIDEWSGSWPRALARGYGAWQLASRDDGPSDVYLIHLEYIPRKVDGKFSAELKEVTETTFSEVTKLVKSGQAVSPKSRTIIMLRELRKMAEVDRRFTGLIDLAVDLSDHDIYLVDFQPENFGRTLEGTIKLLDPSVPSGPRGRPEHLTIESRLDFALLLPRLEF